MHIFILYPVPVDQQYIPIHNLDYGIMAVSCLLDTQGISLIFSFSSRSVCIYIYPSMFGIMGLCMVS